MTERERKIITKIFEHANDGDGASEAYAHDRLQRIQELCEILLVKEESE